MRLLPCRRLAGTQAFCRVSTTRDVVDGGCWGATHRGNPDGTCPLSSVVPGLCVLLFLPTLITCFSFFHSQLPYWEVGSSHGEGEHRKDTPAHLLWPHGEEPAAPTSGPCPGVGGSYQLHVRTHSRSYLFILRLSLDRFMVCPLPLPSRSSQHRHLRVPRTHLNACSVHERHPLQKPTTRTPGGIPSAPHPLAL